MLYNNGHKWPIPMLCLAGNENSTLRPIHVLLGCRRCNWF